MSQEIGTCNFFWTSQAELDVRDIGGILSTLFPVLCPTFLGAAVTMGLPVGTDIPNPKGGLWEEGLQMLVFIGVHKS